MSIGAFLGAVAGPLAKRVLAALGIGAVSFVGLDLALSSILTAAKNSWSGLPAEILGYMSFLGANQALSIIAGAMTARVALVALKRLAML